MQVILLYVQTRDYVFQRITVNVQMDMLEINVSSMFVLEGTVQTLLCAHLMVHASYLTIVYVLLDTQVQIVKFLFAMASMEQILLSVMEMAHVLLLTYVSACLDSLNLVYAMFLFAMH
jgi:hypothetical protein